MKNREKEDAKMTRLCQAILKMLQYRQLDTETIYIVGEQEYAVYVSFADALETIEKAFHARGDDL